MSLLSRWRRRRPSAAPTRAQAVQLLRDAKRAKARVDRYEANPNDGYATPDRSLPPPPGIGAP